MESKDRYNYLQGRRYAAEIVMSLQSMIGDQVSIDQVTDRLEILAAESSASFAEGVRTVLDAVREG